MKRLKSMRESLGLYSVGGLIIAVLICVAVGDLKAGDYWLPVAGSDCQVWSDEPLAKGEIIRWSGRCHAGKLAGKGILEVFENDKQTLRFDGVMLAGKAEGHGKLEIAGKNGTEQVIDATTEGYYNVEISPNCCSAGRILFSRQSCWGC